MTQPFWLLRKMLTRTTNVAWCLFSPLFGELFDDCLPYPWISRDFDHNNHEQCALIQLSEGGDGFCYICMSTQTIFPQSFAAFFEGG